MEQTLIILKPSAIQRELIGEILGRFERKGLYFTGLKMILLSDKILDEHYAHLKDKPFFKSMKEGMQVCPVIVGCIEGKDAVKVVRTLCGTTNGREALPGTIRGDFSVSVEQNIIHASDCPENAKIEINRFFKTDEIFSYKPSTLNFRYGNNEID
jgi:nucleoside-diphosphate kinase